MKKRLIALTALALATPALASQPLPFDTTPIYDDGTGDSGCTPVMSFKQGAVYTVNYQQRWQQVFADNPDNEFNEHAWLFTLDKKHAQSVKFNGKFATPADEDTYFAHPVKGDNKIEIVKAFTGTICFNGAG